MRPLIWFRSDLRTTDNTALHRACAAADRGVVAVFNPTPEQWRRHDWGAAKAGFVLRNVHALARSLAELNIPLRIIETPAFEQTPPALLETAHQNECDALYFNIEHEVNEDKRDRRVRDAFRAAKRGLEVHAFHDQTVLPPGGVRTKDGGFYSVFTPYRNNWMKAVKDELPLQLLPRPKKQDRTGIEADDVPASADGFGDSPIDAALWPAGEGEAQRRLEAFIADGLDNYRKERDKPAADGTSTLSPYLACGAISPRQCLAAAIDANRGRIDTGRQGPVTWISELVWREFYRHVLVGYPHVCKSKPYRRETDKLPWRYDEDDFAAWCEGRTGVPIVDAAMRQLNQTGWMHNRLRMIVAMYLTKDLFIEWRWGERYFMNRLVDGDFANNNGGWQWSASTGTDAAPYFRIFNPVSQSEKCDPDGAFIRRYCPELKTLGDKAVHDPSRLPDDERQKIDYPEPIVDHAEARERTLEAFKALK